MPSVPGNGQRELGARSPWTGLFGTFVWNWKCILVGKQIIKMHFKIRPDLWDKEWQVIEKHASFSGERSPMSQHMAWQAAFGLNLIFQSPICLCTSAVSQSPWGQTYTTPPNNPKKQKTPSHYTHIFFFLKTLIARINVVMNEDALISQAPLETQDKEGGHSAKSPGCSYQKKEKGLLSKARHQMFPDSHI